MLVLQASPQQAGAIKANKQRLIAAKLEHGEPVKTCYLLLIRS